MISVLIYFLIVALVLYLIYFVAGMFISGKPLQVIGVILLLVLVLYALNLFGVALPGPPLWRH